MVIETKDLNRRPGAAPMKVSPMKGPRSPARQFAVDTLQLAELQVELLRTDMRGAAKTTGRGIVIGLVSACLLLAATPVLLLAFAEWIVMAFELPHAASLAVVGAVTVVIAGVLLSVAYSTCKHATCYLNRSREEFLRNLEWFKTTLSSDSESETSEPRPNYPR
jgi:hypothetical protein